MSLKTVAILGGSFDPPHVGHQQLARDLKSYFDEVWVVPCGERSDKHTMSSANLRFQMAQAAFKENQVLDIEIRNGSMIPSYFLIRRLSDEHPDYKFSLIIGLDLLSTLHTWNEADKLINEINFAVISRKGFTLSQETQDIYLSKPNFQSIPDPDIIELSSSRVRTDIKNIRSSSHDAARNYIRELGFLSDDVIDIIIDNNLYV